MRDLFLNLLRTSAVVGLLSVLLALASPLWNRRFAALWKKRLWCLLAVMLLAGVFLRLPEGAVEVELPARQVAVLRSVQGTAGTHVRIIDPDSILEAAPGTVPDLLEQAAQGPSATPSPAVVEQVRGSVDVTAALAVLWAAGAAAFLLWLAAGELLFRRQVRRWGSAVKDQHLLDIYDSACRALGIKGRRPPLLSCPAAASPMLAGLLSPKLLLPTEAYTETEASYILRHELIHWKSRDLWWKLLLLTANAVHWFNPAVWLLRREANRDLERACDERVMEGADDAARRTYSAVLLSAVRKGRRPALSTYFYGGARTMKERLRNILSGTKRRGAALAVVCGLLAACAVPLVSCTQKMPEEKGNPALTAYFEEHFRPETDACIFADLTHDGQNELVVVQLWGDEAMTEPLSSACPAAEEFALGRVTVLCARDGENAAELWSHEISGSHAGWGELYLYRQAGEDYLLQYSPYSSTGASEYAYRLFWLDGGGQERIQAENAVSFVTDRPEPLPQDGDASREEIDAFGHEVFTYLQRAQVLLAYDEAEDAGQAFGCLGTRYAVFAEIAGDPEEAPEAVQALAWDYVQGRIEAWEQDIYVQLDGEPEPEHVKILDSQITKLQCLSAVPAPDGSGAAQVWSLSYQLKPETPERMTLMGDTEQQYGWCPVNDGSDLQPILGIWADGKGNYSLIQWQTARGIREEMAGSCDYYGAELVQLQTGLRPETAKIPVLSENSWQTESWHLERMDAASIYLPDGVQAVSPEWAEALEHYDRAYLWQDPEQEDTAVCVLHQTFGQMGPDSAGEALSQAHAGSRAHTEPLDMGRDIGSLRISGGISVKQVSAVSGSQTGGSIWRAYTVSDGANGFWAVVTASPREDGRDSGGWGAQAAVTFHPGPLTAGCAQVGEASWDGAEPYEAQDAVWSAWPDGTAEASADDMGELLADVTLPDGTEVVCYWTKEHVDRAIPSQGYTDADYVKYWAIRRGGSLLRFCQEYSAYSAGYGVEPFQDVFGRDGFRVIAPRGAAYTAYDYYYLDEDGVPRLLAECANYVEERDLNGDGEKELLWFYHLNEAYYYFQKAGELYLADIRPMVEAAMPGWRVAGVSPQDGDAIPIRYFLEGDQETYYDALLRFTPEALEIYSLHD